MPMFRMRFHSPSAERRAFRVPLRVEAAPAEGRRPRFLGYVANLSTTGAFVQSLRPRVPGTRIDFRIHLPSPLRRTVSIVGEVVWSRQPGGAGSPSSGMGIRFVEVDPPDLEAVARVCRPRAV